MSISINDLELRISNLERNITLLSQSNIALSEALEIMNTQQIQFLEWLESIKKAIAQSGVNCNV